MLDHARRLFAAFLLATLSFVPAVFGGVPTRHETWSRISIPGVDAGMLHRLGNIGVDLESASGRVGGRMEFIVSEFDRTLLGRDGIRFDVVDADLQHTYETAAKGRRTFSAAGFGNGSMGGYYTFSEIVHQLDSMHAAYPSIVSEKTSIGTTSLGRAMWMVRISATPDVTDENKPEVLYTALHHAREPGGMMAVLYYMWWLVEHYGSDPRATYLVNNRQMCFIPVVNPDGYEYNREIAPNGGGFWRKNRIENGDGTYGVDLNRNYGPVNMWNAPNSGSSTTPGSDTYRGTDPFSEAETKAMDNLMRAHKFQIALNFHTYGNYLIYPFGCFNHESEDSVAFRELAFDMTAVNRYKSGTDWETVNYGTRGTSDDYMYGDDTKYQTFAMTPEAGYSFWTDPSDVVGIATENLAMNMHASFAAGQYTICTRAALTDTGLAGNGFPDRGEGILVNLTLRNKGLRYSDSLRCSISDLEGGLILGATAIDLPPVEPRLNVTATIHATVSPTALTGRPMPLIVTLSDKHGYSHSDTMLVTLGTPAAVINDNVDDGTSSWVMDGWQITSSDAYASAVSYTDSQEGNYPPRADRTLCTAVPLDLKPYNHAVLKFWSRWAIEPRFDFGRVEVSPDSGGTWHTLPATYTRRGSGNGVQSEATFGFDGYSPGMEWVESTVDISEFAGTELFVQFRMLSDGAGQKDGWYVDDIRLFGYSESTLGVDDRALRPSSDRLLANYPNPFNPSTMIPVELSQPAYLSVRVYDILGRETATLFNGQSAAGRRELRLDASKLSSGIYFCRMFARHSDGTETVRTAKMLLAR